MCSADVPGTSNQLAHHSISTLGQRTLPDDVNVGIFLCIVLNLTKWLESCGACCMAQKLCSDLSHIIISRTSPHCPNSISISHHSIHGPKSCHPTWQAASMSCTLTPSSLMVYEILSQSLGACVVSTCGAFPPGSTCTVSATCGSRTMAYRDY